MSSNKLYAIQYDHNQSCEIKSNLDTRFVTDDESYAQFVTQIFHNQSKNKSNKRFFCSACNCPIKYKIVEITDLKTIAGDHQNDIDKIKLNRLYPEAIVNELSPDYLSYGDIKLINDAKDFIDNIRSKYDSSFSKC